MGIASGRAGSLEEVISIEEVEFQGVATDAKGNRVAILNNEMVKEGVTVGKLTVKDISRDSVLIKIDEEEHALTIYEKLIQ